MTPGGPTGGFSGSSCWGIGMTDNYPDNYTCHLTSPIYDLSGETTVFLSFHYWMATETGFDGVNVQVFDGLDWQVINPLSNYTDEYLGGLDNQSGWAGDSGAWRGAVFDVSDWSGGDFVYRLKFGSDSGVNGEGFWIDDICMWLGGPVTGVEMDPPPATHPQLSVSPNPFNPITTIAWRIPTAGHLRIDVHDVRGRLVRVLADESVSATSGSLQWNGRDDGDRNVASGVYLVRVRGDRGDAVCRRVLLAK